MHTDCSETHSLHFSNCMLRNQWLVLSSQLLQGPAGVGRRGRNSTGETMRTSSKGSLFTLWAFQALRFCRDRLEYNTKEKQYALIALKPLFSPLTLEPYDAKPRVGILSSQFFAFVQGLGRAGGVEKTHMRNTARSLLESILKLFLSPLYPYDGKSMVGILRSQLL